MNALSIHRVANKLYVHNIPVIPKILQLLIFLIYNSYIPYELHVGRATRLGHRGIGVVINKEAIIGENVLIRAHVTIGKKEEDGLAPCIGDNVVIGDGAKILGEIKIGDNAVIGANAVVIKDVDAGSIVVGVPAKPLKP